MSGEAYRAAHRQELCDKEKARYHANRERHGHKLLVRVSRQEQRARQAWRRAAWNFGERVAFVDWLPIWMGQCFGCERVPAEGVDHVLPKARGGRNVLDNLQPGCLPCNQRKSDL